MLYQSSVSQMLTLISPEVLLSTTSSCDELSLIVLMFDIPQRRHIFGSGWDQPSAPLGHPSVCDLRTEPPWTAAPSLTFVAFFSFYSFYLWFLIWPCISDFEWCKILLVWCRQCQWLCYDLSGIRWRESGMLTVLHGFYILGVFWVLLWLLLPAPSVPAL